MAVIIAKVSVGAEGRDNNYRGPPWPSRAEATKSVALLGCLGTPAILAVAFAHPCASARSRLRPHDEMKRDLRIFSEVPCVHHGAEGGI